MNHVATYDNVHGKKAAVIGVNVAHEPGIQKYHGSAFIAWHSPKTWAALSNFSSVQAFVDRYNVGICVNLANAVKESNYPVWTRSNDYHGAHLTYNEARRATVGTSLDCIGHDLCSDSFTSAFNFGHTASWDGKDFSAGRNVPTIMENSRVLTDGHGVLLAALAGGALYDVYDFMRSDNL